MYIKTYQNQSAIHELVVAAMRFVAKCVSGAARSKDSVEQFTKCLEKLGMHISADVYNLGVNNADEAYVVKLWKDAYEYVANDTRNYHLTAHVFCKQKVQELNSLLEVWNYTEDK